jgi:PAT family beta-lactamase induction signal transducer AmpG
MAGAIGFENIASGIGGVTVIAYFAALTDLRYTAAQYALISAAASIVGRLLTGTTAGALVEAFGYVNFYLLTTVIALPGVLPVLVDDARGADRPVDRHGRHEGEGGRREGRRA